MTMQLGQYTSLFDAKLAYCDKLNRKLELSESARLAFALVATYGFHPWTAISIEADDDAKSLTLENADTGEQYRLSLEYLEELEP